MIAIDIPAKKITLNVSDEEMQERKEAWSPPELKITHRYMARYARRFRRLGIVL